MLERNQRMKIFNAMLNNSSALTSIFSEGLVIQFLSKLFDLKNLTSEDPRFANALEDAIQHIVNNDDWDATYVFTNRFNVIDDDALFSKFIDTIINPEFQKDKDAIISIVSTINNELNNSQQKLALIEYYDELPVFKLVDKKNSINLPVEIPENAIPFFTRIRANIFPSFTLKFIEWNDYGVWTSFEMTYNESENSRYAIGRVKILKKGSINTNTVLADYFNSLSHEFCSLGQGEEYYKRLRHYFPENINSILLALKDVAAFPRIHEHFEYSDNYKSSLIRTDEAERLSRVAKYLIQGKSENEYFDFSYIHKPQFSENQIALNFNFDILSEYERRVFAIIGKNGCGKTQVMAALANDLAKKQRRSFSPHMPIFGKVITISYSHFDRFLVPESDAQFNYVYCGLKKGASEYKSDDEMRIEFYESADKIIKNGRYPKWISILSQFFTSDIIENFKINEIQRQPPQFAFDRESFADLPKKFSSGESIILQLITRILSEIRLNSLLIFDEPETHLHPNAIASLVNAVYEITSLFKSFCIFATHSPIIIQEIPAKNIVILERDENYVSVRFLENESFGENLTIITQEIFGGKEVPQNFVNQISKLVDAGMSRSEIHKVIMSDDRPLSLTVALHINSLTAKE